MTQPPEIQIEEGRKPAMTYANLLRYACDRIAGRLQIIGTLCVVGGFAESVNQYSPLVAALEHQGYTPPGLVKIGAVIGVTGIAVERWARRGTDPQVEQQLDDAPQPLPQTLQEEPWGSTGLMAHWESVQAMLTGEPAGGPQQPGH